MITERMSAKPGSPVVLHSQIILPKKLRLAPPALSLEDYESLWIRVNRICDRYVPSRTEPVVLKK